MEKSSHRPGTPLPVPSKTIIINWLKSLFPDICPNQKIQEFGNGVVYCRIMNHYYGSPHLQKINWNPKNEYEYINNLKNVQTTLLQQGLTLPFDVNKISKKKFLENWQLINILYKNFTSSTEHQGNTHVNDENSVANFNSTFKALKNYPKKQGSMSVTKNYPPQPSYLKYERRQHFQPRFEEVSPLKKSAHPNFFPPMESPYYQKEKPQMLEGLPFSNIDFNSLANHSLNMTQFWKQNMNNYGNGATSQSPAKGKWSCGAQFFQNNQSAIIDRIKEILLKTCNDMEKVKQAKMLLGMPVEEEQVIKIEEDEIGQICFPHIEDKFLQSSNACSKEVKLQADSKENIPAPRKESCTKDINKVSVGKSARKPFKI